MNLLEAEKFLARATVDNRVAIATWEKLTDEITTMIAGQYGDLRAQSVSTVQGLREQLGLYIESLSELDGALARLRHTLYQGRGSTDALSNK